MRYTRSTVRSAPALLLAFCAGIAAAQTASQTFPTKPIRFIVPTAPGGGSDLIARALGQKYTQAWGQPVVVDHRPGAGMTIGIDLVAKATPDGHTVVLVNPSHAINATLMAKLPYDPVRDLIPVTVIATQAYAVVVSPTLAAKNIRELIALAKAKPRELSYASSGPGSASHLATEMLSGMAGIEMIHVPYKGTDPLGNTPREAADFLKVEIARWGKAVKQAGVKIE